MKFHGSNKRSCLHVNHHPTDWISHCSVVGSKWVDHLAHHSIHCASCCRACRVPHRRECRFWLSNILLVKRIHVLLFQRRKKNFKDKGEEADAHYSNHISEDVLLMGWMKHNTKRHCLALTIHPHSFSLSLTLVVHFLHSKLFRWLPSTRRSIHPSLIKTSLPMEIPDSSPRTLAISQRHLLATRRWLWWPMTEPPDEKWGNRQQLPGHGIWTSGIVSEEPS